MTLRERAAQVAKAMAGYQDGSVVARNAVVIEQALREVVEEAAIVADEKCRQCADRNDLDGDIVSAQIAASIRRLGGGG